MPRTESIAPVLLANMQIFARCGGVHGTLALDVDMWQTVWSTKRDVLRRLAVPDTCSDAVRALAQTGGTLNTNSSAQSLVSGSVSSWWCPVSSKSDRPATTTVHPACE